MSTVDIPKKTKLTFKRGFHLQILFKNQISGVTEPKTTIDSHSLGKNPNKQFFDEGENDTHLWDFTLAQLREQLGKKVDAKWSFCLENCAPVDDSSTLCYYLTLPESNVKLLQEPLPDKDGELTEAAVLSLLSVYMAVGNAMAPAAKGFGAEWAEKHPVNMALTDRSKAELAAPTVPANHKAEYGPEAAWTVANVAPGASGMLDCVVDFAESDWDKITIINKSLYAFDVRGKRLEVTSARLPAFELKGIKDDVQIPGNHLRQFVEIRDTPHIDITEVSSEFQSSLVDNAFSARSLEAMVSGGTPLVSASVSAGIKSESSKGSGSNEGSQRREYRATYNFPRVSLFLDEYTLKVSKYCDEALKALKSAPTIDNLRQFQRRFGVIFAQEVTLGGRLESTKAADSSFSAENSSVKDALKASLGAAFSYGPASASANASMENQVGHDAGNNNQKASSAVSYTARGGDTLLCANPAAWASSVAVWRNWRVIQQDEPVSLQELLGRFKEYEFVPGLFAQTLGPPPSKESAPVKTIPDKIFDANKSWTKTTKLCLWIGQDKIPLDNFYAVRDGNPTNESASSRDTLLADYPLLLFLGDAPQFVGQDLSTMYVDRETGALGPQTANKGQFRFSLRKSGSTGNWNPTAAAKIINGQKVTLWCHSIGLGGWRSLNEPPSNAYQAFWKKSTKVLEFDTAKATHSAVGGFEPADFVVEFV